MRVHSLLLRPRAVLALLLALALACLAAPRWVAADPGPSAPVDTRFGLAVIPDTQQEVLQANDPRFTGRTQWLVKNRKRLDLRFVAHTGDVVNWGWLVPSQYAVADDAMAVLDRAGIPYALSIGNHDTRAVGHDGVPGSRGYGGSAYANNPECVERFSPEECNTRLLVRHTEEFNDTFPLGRYRNVGGAFEPGKVDNVYSTFQAGGVKWLVLTLELWPRPEAVEWAANVAATHPDHNVVVQTHHYLNGDGSLGQSAEYGATSPQYLFDHLISRYPNIKLVFSGHTGQTASRVDTGIEGNKIVSIMTTIHSNTTNPVQLLDIDTATGTIRTRVYSPHTDETSDVRRFSGLSFVGTG